MHIIAIITAAFAILGFAGTARELSTDGLRRQPVRWN